MRVPLGEVVQFNPKPHKGELKDDSEVSFVPMAAVEAGSGRMDASTIRPYHEVKKGFTYFADGDVLFAKITPCMENGKSAVATGLRHGVGFGSTEFHVLRPTERIDARYLYQFIAGAGFRREAAHHMTGAVGQKRVPVDFLRHAEIPLPSLSDQRSIVAEIEKQFSRLDEAVANLRRVKANLRRLRAAVLASATAGTLLEDGTLEGWTNTEIGSVAKVISGLTKNPKRQALPRKMPYLRVANVYANELRLDQIETIGISDNEVEKLLVRPGDLLVVEGNGSADQIGRVALWDGSIPNCVHQNHLIKVRFDPTVLPEWALAWLLSPGGRHQIEQVSSSTAGLHTLSTGKVARLPIPVPPLEEQHSIVAEVDRRLSIVRGVEAEVDTNLKRAQALRQAVLQRAFTNRSAVEVKTTAARPAPRLIPGTGPDTETARVALSAEIVHRLHGEPHFGRVKLQKIIHLSEYIAGLERVQGHYVRAAAGPLDLPMIEACERSMKALGWYAERPRTGGSGHEYHALSKAGEHKPYLACFTDEQLRTVHKLIELMRDWKTERCEMFSTVYAAWNDLLLFGAEPTPEAIASEILKRWNDAKLKITRHDWLKQIEWVRTHGFIPKGLGRSTRGQTDGLTPDLFQNKSR